MNNKYCKPKTIHIDTINQNTDFATSSEDSRKKRSIFTNTTYSYYQINNETKPQNDSIRISEEVTLFTNSSTALAMNRVQNNNNSDHGDAFCRSSLRSNSSTNSSQIQDKPTENFTSVIDLRIHNTLDSIEDFTATDNKTRTVTKFLQTIDDSTSLNDRFHKIISVMYHILKSNNFVSTEAANNHDKDKSSLDITTESIHTDNSDDSATEFLSSKTKSKIHKIQQINTFTITMAGVFAVVVIAISSRMYFQSRKKKYHCWNNQVLEHTTCL